MVWLMDSWLLYLKLVSVFTFYFPWLPLLSWQDTLVTLDSFYFLTRCLRNSVLSSSWQWWNEDCPGHRVTQRYMVGAGDAGEGCRLMQNPSLSLCCVVGQVTLWWGLSKRHMGHPRVFSVSTVLYIFLWTEKRSLDLIFQFIWIFFSIASHRWPLGPKPGKECSKRYSQFLALVSSKVCKELAECLFRPLWIVEWGE